MSQRTFIIFFEHNLVQKKNYNITMYCTYVTGTCDYLIIIIFWIQSSAEKNIFAYDSTVWLYSFWFFLHNISAEK